MATKFLGTVPAAATDIAIFGNLPRTDYPSYLTALVQLHAYDVELSSYNANDVTRRSSRALVNRATNGTLEHIVCIGDSETASFCADGIYDQRRMWPRRMRDQLCIQTGAASGGEGLVWAYYSGQADPRTTPGTGWTNASGYSGSNTNGSTYGFVSSETASVVEMYYIDTTGSFSVTVDGANVKAVTTTGSGSAKKLVWTGLPLSPHTVVVTNTAASGTSSYLIGVGFYNTSGIVVHNLGVYGVTAQSYAGTAAYGLGWIATALYGGLIPGTSTAVTGVISGVSAPPLIVCQLGVNDINTLSRTPTQVATDLTTIRNTFPLATAFMFCVQQQPSSLTTAAWNSWALALYSLADTLGCVLWDWYAHTQGYSLATTDGMLGSDGLHPTQAWQYEQGRIVAVVLIGGGGSGIPRATSYASITKFGVD